MNLYNILTLLFGSGILAAVGRYFMARIKASEKKTEAVCLGVQALLRDRLISTYNRYIEKGYAPIYAKENFENMYHQYHELGANGVMEEIHKSFIKLPTEKIGDHNYAECENRYYCSHDSADRSAD